MWDAVDDKVWTDWLDQFHFQVVRQKLYPADLKTFLQLLNINPRRKWRRPRNCRLTACSARWDLVCRLFCWYLTYFCCCRTTMRRRQSTPPMFWRTRVVEWSAPPSMFTSAPSVTTPATRPTPSSTAPTTRSSSGSRQSWPRSGRRTERPDLVRARARCPTWGSPSTPSHSPDLSSSSSSSSSTTSTTSTFTSPCQAAQGTTADWAPPPPSPPPPPPLWCLPTPQATSPPSPPRRTSAASPAPPGLPRTWGQATTPSWWRTSSSCSTFLTNNNSTFNVMMEGGDDLWKALNPQISAQRPLSVGISSFVLFFCPNC